MFRGNLLHRFNHAPSRQGRNPESDLEIVPGGFFQIRLAKSRGVILLEALLTVIILAVGITAVLRSMAGSAQAYAKLSKYQKNLWKAKQSLIRVVMPRFPDQLFSHTERKPRIYSLEPGKEAGIHNGLVPVSIPLMDEGDSSDHLILESYKFYDNESEESKGIHPP